MNKITSKENRLTIIIALIFLLSFGTAGVLILVSSIQKKVNCSENTKGIVIENRRSYSNGKHKYSPIVQFEVDGKINIVKSNVAASPKTFDEGDTVTIFYNPKNVNEIWIKGHFSFAFIFLGIILLVVGVGIFIVIIHGVLCSDPAEIKEQNE